MGKAFGWGWTTDVQDHDNPTFTDFEVNGLHCEDGLAIPGLEITEGREQPWHVAKCAKIQKVMQNGVEIGDPANENSLYSCNPTDSSSPCEFYYHGYGLNEDLTEQDPADAKFFTVPCKCALDGTQRGYCSSVIGTETYRLGLQSIKYMLEWSRCHTLDRGNMRA